MKNAILALATLAALSAGAEVKWFAVDPMGETPYMPDSAPKGGREGAPVQIVAARGEYEPGSLVLVADEDVGKVKLEIGDLKNEKGEIFPSGRFDLKTVKVWYQAGNAWTSYFGDPKLKLCPELLLNDEDLVKVDTKKGWNYARLTEKDGSVSYRWLNPPRPVDNRTEDAPGCRLDDSFLSMKPNFADAETHQGVTLKKGEYKQLFLTAEVGKDVKPGVYRGKVSGFRFQVSGSGKREAEKSACFEIPVAVRVLDFELPEPKCYFDCEKDFNVWFCEYVSLDWIVKSNGNDLELAKRQLTAILRDFVRHGEKTPCYDGKTEHPEFGQEAGMVFDGKIQAGVMYLGEKAEMRYRARRQKDELTKKFGWHPFYMWWGDEFGLATLRGVRDMVEIYHQEGFRWPVNSQAAYDAAAYISDIWWPPYNPDHRSAGATFKYNQLGGDGYFGWYACQHVGNENPAFCRRQYGFGPYRAGLSCDFNYAHHLQGWNDIGHDLYRPMMFVYGSGNGCLDTLQWEGFREGLDDIRYATKLLQLAKPLVGGTPEQRYAAKKALQLLADADGDDMDLTTLRLEMIRHIEKLSGLAVNRLSGEAVAKK